MRDGLEDGVVDRVGGKEKAIARIADGRQKAHLEGPQRRLFPAPVEPAHPLVDQSQQIGHAVGHRRVAGERALVDGAPCRARLAAAKGALGFRDEITQDIQLFRHRRAAAKHHFGKLFKPHQPERQVQRIGVDDHGLVGEGGGKFVVRIKDQHPKLRVCLDCLVEEKRDGGRLADAGRADDGKVLGQHRGNMDCGVDGLVLRQRADHAAASLSGIINALQIIGANAVGNGAKMRVAGNAGGKALRAIIIHAHFAQKLHLDTEFVAAVFAPSAGTRCHRIGECHHAVASDADRDQAPDRPELGELRRTGILHGGNGGMGARAGNHPSEKPVSGRQAVTAVCVADALRALVIVMAQGCEPSWAYRGEGERWRPRGGSPALPGRRIGAGALTGGCAAIPFPAGFASGCRSRPMFSCASALTGGNFMANSSAHDRIERTYRGGKAHGQDGVTIRR